MWLILALRATGSACWMVCNLPSIWSIPLLSEGLVYVGCWGFFSSGALSVLKRSCDDPAWHKQRHYSTTSDIAALQQRGFVGWEPSGREVMPMNNPWGSMCVCACLYVCELFSHLCDSPLILSLDCCIHAHFLYVTILLFTRMKPLSGLPSIPGHMSIASSHCACDLSHQVLSHSAARFACVPLNLFLTWVYLYT